MTTLSPHDHGILALACERHGEGFLGQPANTVTSLAFVAAGVAIVLARLGGVGRGTYALLVTGVGLGSVIQHGPHPDWQAYAHDLPLAGVLAFVAVDAAADLLERGDIGSASPKFIRSLRSLRNSVGGSLPAVWWLVPTAAIAPLVAIGPGASSAGQVTLAAAAIGLNLRRACVRPRLRRRILTALSVLGVGGLIGTLGERTSLCQQDSLLQGHAVWHVLAAIALWQLTPVIGSRGVQSHDHRR